MSNSEESTLCVTGSNDLAEVGTSFAEKLEVALDLVDQSAAVVTAAEQVDSARDRCRRLERCALRLAEQSKVLLSKISEASAGFVESVIAHFCDEAGNAYPADKLEDLAGLENERRSIVAAIQRVAEVLTPLAEIERLRCEGGLLVMRADAAEQLAGERAAKLAATLADAVALEGALPLNLAGTVSGMLLSRANEWRAEAGKILRRADELWRLYQERQTKGR